MNTDVIHQVLAESQAGKLVFPEVIRRLLEVGIESYFADMAKGEETFYLLDGKTHVEKMTLPLTPIAQEFSSVGIVSAIRAAQTDSIRYPSSYNARRQPELSGIGYF